MNSKSSLPILSVNKEPMISLVNQYNLLNNVPTVIPLEHEDQNLEVPQIEHVKQPQIEYVEQPQIEYVDQPQIEYVDPPEIEYVDQPQIEYVDQPQIEYVDQPQIEYVDQPQIEYVDPPEIEYVDQPQIKSGGQLQILNEEEKKKLKKDIDKFKKENEKLINEINKLKDENKKLNMELIKANKIISNFKNNQNNQQGNNINITDNLKELINVKDNKIKNLELQLQRKIETKTPVNFEDIIVVHFISMDQKINCALKCLKTDTFASVEEKLYQKYGDYRETNNNFITKGKIVLRFKKIFENNIKDGDKIELINLE